MPHTVSLTGSTGGAKVAQNLTAHIGEDLVITYTVTDAASAAVPLSGYTIAWEAAKHPFTAATLTVAGAVVGDGSAGQFTVTLTDIATDAIEPRVYYHDAKITDGSGNEVVVARGSIAFVPSAT